MERRGFTLMELLLVMVIISVLVAGFIVTFGCKIRAKAYKAQIDGGLGGLATADAAYFQEYGHYAGSPAVLKSAGYIEAVPSSSDVKYTSSNDGVWTGTRAAGGAFANASRTKNKDGTITDGGNWDCT